MIFMEDAIFWGQPHCEDLEAIEQVRACADMELSVLDSDVAEKTAQQWENYGDAPKRHLVAIRTILDEEEPDYRH